MLKIGQILTAELLDKLLAVRLNLALGTKLPCTALGCHIDIAQIVVRIVYQIGLETALRQFLNLHWHKSEKSTKLVAAFTLFGFSFKSNRTIGGFYLGFFLIFSCLTCLVLNLNHTGCLVALLAYYHNLVNHHRHLESVFVFNQYDVLSLKAGNLSAAYFAQESYFISYFHNPNKFFNPPSTPEKPMNAKLSSPAESITMAIPCMPFGILTSSSCSRMPANTVSAKPKPMAVEKA